MDGKWEGRERKEISRSELREIVCVCVCFDKGVGAAAFHSSFWEMAALLGD